MPKRGHTTHHAFQLAASWNTTHAHRPCAAHAVVAGSSPLPNHQPPPQSVSPPPNTHHLHRCPCLTLLLATPPPARSATTVHCLACLRWITSTILRSPPNLCHCTLTIVRSQICYHILMTEERFSASALYAIPPLIFYTDLTRSATFLLL